MSDYRRRFEEMGEALPPVGAGTSVCQVGDELVFRPTPSRKELRNLLVFLGGTGFYGWLGWTMLMKQPWPFLMTAMFGWRLLNQTAELYGRRDAWFFRLQLEDGRIRYPVTRKLERYFGCLARLRQPSAEPEAERRSLCWFRPSRQPASDLPEDERCLAATEIAAVLLSELWQGQSARIVSVVDRNRRCHPLLVCADGTAAFETAVWLARILDKPAVRRRNLRSHGHLSENGKADLRGLLAHGALLYAPESYQPPPEAPGVPALPANPERGVAGCSGIRAHRIGGSRMQRDIHLAGTIKGTLRYVAWFEQTVPTPQECPREDVFLDYVLIENPFDLSPSARHRRLRFRLPPGENSVEAEIEARVVDRPLVGQVLTRFRLTIDGEPVYAEEKGRVLPLPQNTLPLPAEAPVPDDLPIPAREES